MKLRVFLPAAERLDPAAPLGWILFDARHAILREDRTPAADLPRAEHVEAILPAERVLFARLELPRVSAATIRELLPYAVEDRLLADPAHIHAVAGATDPRGETVVAVVDREWLRGMVEALAQAGVRPRHAWCESALLEGGDRDWHVVWGPARGMLVDDEGVSATFDPGEGLPLAVRIALDEAAARGERPESIRVHSQGGAPLPDLARWSQEARVSVAAGTQWEVLARGGVSHRAIDLMRGAFGRGAPALGRAPRAAAILAGVILALQTGLTIVDELRLRRERDALEARREAVFREAFPEARVVVDPELQMARNLAELRRTRGLSSGDEFLAQLTRVAHGREGRVRSIEYADGKLVAR